MNIIIRTLGRATTRTVILCLTAFAFAAVAATATAQSPEALKRKVAGNEYQKRREYDAAKLQYMEALRLDPQYSDVHYNLGMLYFYRTQEFDKALYHLNAYRRLEPNASDMNQVLSHVTQSIEALEAVEREDYKAAVLDGTAEAFEKFIEKHPTGYYNEKAREELGKFRRYEDMQSRKEAEVTLAFSRALEKGTPEAMDRFLTKYPNVEQSEQARELRTQWLDRRKNEQVAYQDARDLDSVEALEEFIDVYPYSEFTPKAKARIAHLEGAEEALTLAREAGSMTALQKFLDIYGDTPYADQARGDLEELRKAEIEKAATEDAMDLINNEIDLGDDTAAGDGEQATPSEEEQLLGGTSKPAAGEMESLERKEARRRAEMRGRVSTDSVEPSEDAATPDEDEATEESASGQLQPAEEAPEAESPAAEQPQAPQE